jgi:hypothetical protein
MWEWVISLKQQKNISQDENLFYTMIKQKYHHTVIEFVDS